MNVHVTDFFSPIFLDPRTILVEGWDVEEVGGSSKREEIHVYI